VAETRCDVGGTILMPPAYISVHTPTLKSDDLHDAASHRTGSVAGFSSVKRSAEVQ